MFILSTYLSSFSPRKIDQKVLRESERNICYVVFVLSTLGASYEVTSKASIDWIMYRVHCTVLCQKTKDTLSHFQLTPPPSNV
jgi:hypothetical protein